MRIIMSKDYKGPGLGFLTKARGFDKWAHLAGSSAGMLLVLWILELVRVPRILIWTIGPWIATIIVGLLGLGLEIYQGKKRWDYEHSDKVFPTSYDPSDGFSVLDLVADAAGILLVWAVIG